MTNPHAKMSFCITMCSRQRPVLLRRALESLCQLNIPDGITLSFLLVENDREPQYAELVQDFKTRLNLKYVVEPQPGLTFARNKILDTMLAEPTDWVGGVDDDQIIDKDWLSHMVTAIRAFPDTKMFVGNWKKIAAETVPDWFPNRNFATKMKDGAIAAYGVAGNSAMHCSVYQPTGMGLRYDPAYNFLGGEDTDFGMQYGAKTGIIRFVRGAITREEIHVERASLQQWLNRISISEYTFVKLRHKHSNHLVALLWSIQIFYRSLVLGMANLFLATVSLPFAEKWAMRRYGVAHMMWARIKGVFGYYFAQPDEQYRTIDGY